MRDGEETKGGKGREILGKVNAGELNTSKHTNVTKPNTVKYSRTRTVFTDGISLHFIVFCNHSGTMSSKKSYLGLSMVDIFLSRPVNFPRHKHYY